jgi:ketosteroid isomerase-like protein
VFEQRVELLRTLYDIWNKGDVDAWIGMHDASAEYDLRAAPMYDLEGVYRGRDGLRDLWDAAREPFGRLLFEPLEFSEGSDGVLVRVVVRARGAGSGIPVQAQQYHVWRFRGGVLWHQEAHGNEDSARRAAGLGAPATGHYPRPNAG